MNLLFIRINPWCVYQNLYWATCAVVGILCFFVGGYGTIEGSLWYSTLINTFFRSATIAGKYGTYPQSEVDRIFEGVIPPSQVRGEMMLDRWNKQESKEVQTELISIDLRENTKILPTTVRISIQAASTSPIQKAKNSHPDTAQVKDIILDLVEAFRKVSSQKELVILMFIYAMFRAALPGLLNLCVSLPFHGEKTEEIIVFYLIYLFQYMYFTVAPMFFLLAFKDIKRHRYLCTQGSALLTGVSNDADVYLLIESDQDKTAALGLIRRIDRYGDRFIQRHKLFVAFMLVHALAIIVFLIPRYFNIFQYTPKVTSEAKLQAMMTIDLITIGLPLIAILALIISTNYRSQQLLKNTEQLQSGDRNGLTQAMKSDNQILVLGINWNAALLIILSLIILAGIGGGIYISLFQDRYKLFGFS